MIDEFGEVLLGPNDGADDSLIDAIENNTVSVIVPGADVLLTTVTVPKMSRAKILKAIPNLLEESLVENLSDVHFAIGEIRAGKPLCVAVVSKEKMNNWLAFLAQNIPTITGRVSSFVPDTLCLGWRKKQWSALLYNEKVLVRTAKELGYVVDNDNFLMLTMSILNSAKAPKLFQLYSNDGQPTGIEQFSFEVKQDRINDPLLVFFAKNLRDSVPLNLLQADFAQQNSTDLTKTLATMAAGLVVVWLSLLTVIDTVKYFVLNSQVGEQNVQIETVYKEIFPKATSVVSPRKRVERLLNDVKGAGASSEFMQTLAMVSPIVDQAKGVTLEELSFSGKDLMIKVAATDFGLLDQLVTSLKGKGLAVVQNQASKSNGKIQSRITIK